MKKKLFKNPEAIIILFENDDIITDSSLGDGPDQDYDDWNKNN